MSRSTSNLSKQHYSTTRVERDPAPGAAPVPEALSPDALSPDALSPEALSADAPTTGSWTFLTNHGHVLLAVHRNPDLRQRDISRLVGITEGAVQRILTELEHGGYIHREKVGRRNHYQIVSDTPLRHPLEQNHTISELLELLED